MKHVLNRTTCRTIPVYWIKMETTIPATIEFHYQTSQLSFPLFGAIQTLLQIDRDRLDHCVKRLQTGVSADCAIDLLLCFSIRTEAGTTGPIAAAIEAAETVAIDTVSSFATQVDLGSSPYL